MAREDESLHELKCSNCPTSSILDLYKKGKGKGIYGGELTVLRASLRDEKSFPIYCFSGLLMCFTCQVMSRDRIEQDDWSEYFFDIFWQFHTDIRTSFFLAFCGHYRASFQIMRSAFENLILGFYLSSFEPEQLDDKMKEYNEFREGKLRFNMNKIFDVKKALGKQKLLTRRQRRKMVSTYETLCEYTHPTPHRYSFDCEKDDCVYSVQLDQDKIIEWNEYFQQSIFLFIVVYVNTFLGIEGVRDNEGAVGILESILSGEIEECGISYDLSSDLGSALETLGSQI